VKKKNNVLQVMHRRLRCVVPDAVVDRHGGEPSDSLAVVVLVSREYCYLGTDIVPIGGNRTVHGK
jgi:hypothetical protein